MDTDGENRAGYDSTGESFRWKQRERLHLTVEFFCPSGAGRPAGKMFRPKQTENPVAKANFGSSLSALALDAGGVLSEDVILVPREVVLPDGEGRSMSFGRRSISSMCNRDDVGITA